MKMNKHSDSPSANASTLKLTIAKVSLKTAGIAAAGLVYNKA
jgi:hypothetical protein